MERSDTEFAEDEIDELSWALTFHSCQTLATSVMRSLCRSFVDVGPDCNPVPENGRGAIYPGTKLHSATTHPLIHSLMGPTDLGAAAATVN